MAAKKKASRAQLLARARFIAKFGKKKTGKRKAAKKRKAPKRRKATKAKRTGKRRTKAAYMAHKGKLYQCLGPIKRGCGGGASVVVR